MRRTEARNFLSHLSSTTRFQVNRPVVHLFLVNNEENRVVIRSCWHLAAAVVECATCDKLTGHRWPFPRKSSHWLITNRIKFDSIFLSEVDRLSSIKEQHISRFVRSTNDWTRSRRLSFFSRKGWNLNSYSTNETGGWTRRKVNASRRWTDRVSRVNRKN